MFDSYGLYGSPHALDSVSNRFGEFGSTTDDQMYLSIAARTRTRAA